MKELKQLLSCLDAETNVETITKTFEEIAEILLFKSHIQTDHGGYRILEIEFYFKNNKHSDDVTIERTEEAGMWWLHDYGVDLSFKSVKSEKYYGGILIRSLMPLDDNQVNKEVIFGPRKCCWELFYSSALEQNSTPRIVVTDEKILSGKMSTTKRYITGETKKVDGDYRFYVDGLTLTIDSNYKKMSPWK